MFLDKHLYSDRGGCGTKIQFSKDSSLEYLGLYDSATIECDDGIIFVPNRMAYQERTGKIRNLYKTTRDFKTEIWSLSPEIPGVPEDAYDYFTWIDVYDEARGLIEAYTGSGYKLVIDSQTGQVQQIQKDRVVHYVEHKGSQIILDDQSVIDLGDKKVSEAIQVDQEIVVLIDHKSYEDVVKMERRISELVTAEKKGLPEPQAPAGFVTKVDNLWKLSLDGKVLKTLAPPSERFRYPAVNFFGSLGVSLSPFRLGVTHTDGIIDYVGSQLDWESFTLTSFKTYSSR